MPFPLLAAAPIIGAGISALSSAFTNNQNLQAQNNYNEDMKNWNEKMWNMNNAYNTPLAQRKRMTEAGLSPQLMYGQGTVGNSSSPVSAPSGAKAPQVQDPLQGANIGLLYAQAKNLEADTANKLAQNPLLAEKLNTQKSTTKLVDEQVLLTNYKSEGQFWQNDYLQNTIKDRKEIIASTNTINKAYANIADERAKKSLQLMQAQIDQAIANKNYTEARKILADNEAELNKFGLSYHDQLEFRMLAKAYDYIVKKYENKK